MMAETETGVPKLRCTPWPYGRADDSAGTDQREDRLGCDGQTRDKWNTHGSHSFQHRQSTESPGRARFSQDDYHYAQWGNRQSSSDPHTRLNHNLRRRMKRSRYQFRLEDHETTVRSLSSAGAGQMGRPLLTTSSQTSGSRKVKRTLPPLRNWTATSLSASRHSNNCGRTVENLLGKLRGYWNVGILIDLKIKNENVNYRILAKGRDYMRQYPFINKLIMANSLSALYF